MWTKQNLLIWNIALVVRDLANVSIHDFVLVLKGYAVN